MISVSGRSICSIFSSHRIFRIQLKLIEFVCIIGPQILNINPLYSELSAVFILIQNRFVRSPRIFLEIWMGRLRSSFILAVPTEKWKNNREVCGFCFLLSTKYALISWLFTVQSVHSVLFFYYYFVFLPFAFSLPFPPFSYVYIFQT